MNERKKIGEYDSRAIANRFVRKAKEAKKQLDFMSLVKFTYIAHGWYLAYANRALICDPVEAWQRGPVIPKVYFAFRRLGVYIKEEALSADGSPYQVDLRGDKKAVEVINFVYDNYSHLGPFKLSAITHRRGTPWEIVLYKLHRGPYAEIPNDIIKQYYQNYLNER